MMLRYPRIKLQTDSELTLEKAILKARQSEMVKKQQQELRSQFQVTEEVTSLQMIRFARSHRLQDNNAE